LSVTVLWKNIFKKTSNNHGEDEDVVEEDVDHGLGGQPVLAMNFENI
jgi:hypothetical protein